MSRSDALAAYEELPLPDTTEEHWRFTDLRGFDPDSFEGAASAEIETMLDLDVAGYATVTADGDRHREGARGHHLRAADRGHERLYSLVGWDEKFAAHNAALWQHGLLVVVPKGVELEKPLYVRISTTGQTFWRLVVVAEQGARASLIEEYASPAPDTEAYSNAVDRALRRAGREARVRLAPEPLARDVALREPPRARRARRRARLGRRRLRLEEGQDADPERPRGARRDVARDGRVLRRRHAAPRLRHVPGAHRARLRERLRLQGRAARRRRRRCGAG